MLRSLVGSEMCIRDSLYVDPEKEIATLSWDLPWDRPVSMDRIGNELYIVYQDSSKVSVFNINQDTPSASALDAAQFDIPVYPGHVFDYAIQLEADPDNSRIIILYIDDDWPDEVYLCALSSANGSVLIGPTCSAIGNSDENYMDYSGGTLVMTSVGSSWGETQFLRVEADQFVNILEGDETLRMEQFMGKGSLALDSTGSRLAIFCDNDEIEPADTEGIDDMAIGASSVTYQGVWDDSYGSQPLFSHDDGALYCVDKSDNVLRKLDASSTYSFLQEWEWEFTGVSHYALYAISPDDSKALGFYYDSYSDSDYRFKTFELE